MRTKISTLLQRYRPHPWFWIGAAWGILAITTGLVVYWAWGLANGSADFVFLALMIAVFSFLSSALLDLVLQINRLHPFFRWALAACLVALFGAIFMGKLGPSLLPGVLILGMGVLLGAGLAGLLRAETRLGRAAGGAALALGALALAGSAAWYFSPGPALDELPEPVQPAAIPGLTDPGQPGRFAVQAFTYGSGVDLHRPEFAEQVFFKTEPVDGGEFISNWSGFTGDLRTRYWGFDDRKLPLNARVWAPEGDGPFPIVLIAHGNHLMKDFSDAGYAYLGELLASRGIIFVSLDHNFLNGTWTDIGMFGLDGLRRENDGRAWLMLEHLRVWREWNADPNHPFYGKVDLDRVGLAGHSRGGEAAAIAAFFNTLRAYPDNATVKFDYGFGVRGVAAIAPSDGQYTAGTRLIELQDVSYLTVQGSFDADLTYFQGVRQYQRLSFSDPGGPWFKAAVLLERANHGQFNTTWGAADTTQFPAPGFLNRAALLPAEQQERVAAVLLSAFFADTLQDQTGYRAIFRDPRAAAAWLPAEARLVSQYADPTGTILADYEEDFDPITTTLPGGFFTQEGLRTWRESLIPQKDDTAQTTAVLLAWNREQNNGPARYHLALPADPAPSPRSLFFTIGDADLDDGPVAAVDFTIELQDSAGEIAALPLSHQFALRRPVPAWLYKTRFLQGDTKTAETMMQYYEFDLADFQAVNPNFDPAALWEIRWVFDQTDEGRIYLDDVGLR